MEQNREIMVKIRRLTDDAELPFYATSGAAGMDLSAVCAAQGLTLAPMERALVPTGIAVELPEQCVGLLFARSSMGVKRGLALANGVGVIDADYRGEIRVALVNLSGETAVIRHGERIAQLAIMPVLHAQICEVQYLSESVRGEGGFGSTGI